MNSIVGAVQVTSVCVAMRVTKVGSQEGRRGGAKQCVATVARGRSEWLLRCGGVSATLWAVAQLERQRLVDTR